MRTAPVLCWQALLAAALVGCSGALPSGLPDANVLPMDDAGGVAPCPAGSHADSDGGCDASLAWENGPAASTPVNHHVTFIDDASPQASLYVMGGVSGSQGSVMLDAIVRAPLDRSNGQMGTWAPAGTLPRPLAGFTMAKVGQTIMVVSGLTTTGGTLGGIRDTSIGQLDADGSIGAWVAGPSLPGARFHAGATTIGNFTYVFGGIAESGNPTDTVYRSTFDGTTFGAWQTLAPLPGVRSHEAVTSYGGRIYLIAGLRADTFNAADYYLDVLSSEVSDTGDLGPWTTASTVPLTTPVSTESTFVKDGWLYILGGISLVNGSLHLTNDVRRAPIAADGTVGGWEAMPVLPRARGHVHQTPLFANTWVYSVSGTSDLDHDSIPDTFMGVFY